MIERRIERGGVEIKRLGILQLNSGFKTLRSGNRDLNSI